MKKKWIKFLATVFVGATFALGFTACNIQDNNSSSTGQGTSSSADDSSSEQSYIAFNTLSVDGTKVYGKVSNATTEFSFIDEVTLYGTASYVVDNDKDCSSPIASKTVDLVVGDNTFYVLETVGNNVKLYTVTVRRRAMYDVTFNTNGGTPVEKQVVEEDGFVTEPATTKAGYQLAWEYDFSTPITESITISANWTPNTDTAYKVEYYLQDVDGNYPATPNETYNDVGVTDMTAEADVKTFTHFTYDENASTASGNIAGNGSLVLKLYYTRDSYAVKTSGNNTKAGTYTQINNEYRYEKQITLTATTNAGYTFLGWFDGTTCVSDDEQFTYSVEKEVTLVATWEASEGIAYKVEYYLQDVDGNYPATPNETYNDVGVTDMTAEADVKTFTHFTYDENASTASGNIAGNGSLVLKLYYTRDSYTLETNGNNANAGTYTQVNGDYRYEKQITLTATTNAGYTFLGWFDGTTYVSEDEQFTYNVEKEVTLVATWEANEGIAYKVEYYLQDADGNYPATPKETYSDKGVTDTTAEADVKTFTHFTYDENASTASGNIAGNGSLVLKLYYTRDSYAVKTSGNNTKAGTYTQINNEYRYEKQITLTATTNAGYTFLGWFDGTTCVSEDEEFTYKVEKEVTLVATWEASEGIVYTVEYYLQNLDDNKYPATPSKTEIGYGKTDDTVTVTAKTFTHFTYDENASTTSGVVAGNGSLVLKLYYTRDSYTLETNGNNANAGTYTQVNGDYRYEKQITLTATTNTGYEFLGWYDGGKLVSQDEQFTYTVEKDVTLTAKWEIEVHDCEFTDYVSNGDATCTKDGTETAECNHIVCKKTHTRTDVGSASHDFTNYISNNDATCLANGTETAKCNRCTAIDTRTDENSALGHLFTNYVSNNDATYEKDGTKTAECDRDGCKEKDTVTDEGSKLVDRIEFNTLTVDGYSVSGRVSNATEEFNFNEEVSAYGSYGFVVATDKKGTDTIAMRIVDLAEGDNTFYIIVMKNYAPVETYTVSLYRNKLYTVSFENNYAPTQPVDEDDKATEPQITPEKAGYTFTGWDFDFATPITQDITVTANWTPNKDTKYTVECYLQNVDGSYPTTPNETYRDEGETDTTAEADVKTFTHFTYDETASTASGNITGDGSLVLKLYYTRDSYTVATNGNNTKAGTYTQINNEYCYEKQITLTAMTNAGYTFLGWFDGTTCVSEDEEFTYSVEKEVTLVATWEANTDTKYTVEYYLQDVDGNYPATPNETYSDEGETDTTAEADIKTFAHFTYDETASTASGNIAGNGALVLKLYYTRDTHIVSINSADSNIASVAGADTYRYGSEITLTATTKVLGYEVQWYNGETLVGTGAEITVTIEGDVTYTVVAVEDEAMSNFVYTATETTCSITGIKDNTVTSIVVPDYVTSISQGAFSGCTSLAEITLPFVGATKNGTSKTYFGYIFGGNSYSYNDDYVPTSLKKVTITGGSIGSNAFYNCDSLTSVVIPNSVTSIGNYAFYGCSSLTSVVIGDSVTSIGSYAFSNCSSLTSIEIGNSVTSIGSNAFEYCSSLTSIKIPDSVTSIGNNAFGYCSSLTSITVSANNTKYKSIDGNLYSKGGKTLIQYAIGKTATSFTIPNSVTAIGYEAFYNCDSLTSVEIGDSVTSIGSYAFSSCYSLTSVEIGDSVESIGNAAFAHCDRLTSVVIPDSVTSIGAHAFLSCDSLMSVEIGDSVESIGDWAFSGCSSLTSVEIPDSVTSIGAHAFSRCHSLTSITVSENNTKYKSIDGNLYSKDGKTLIQYAYGKTATSFTIPDSVESIDSYAFYDCDSLTSVVIPNSVTSIGNYAFYNCDSLTSIEIGDSVTSIGERAFYYCSSLTSIEIPSSVTGIGDSAFYACSSLTIYCAAESQPSGWNSSWNYDNRSVVWGVVEKGVTDDGFVWVRLKENTMSIIGYTGTQTEISIPNAINNYPVTSIGDYAFSECKQLTSAVIGDSVTSIGDRAFYDCDSLTSVVIGDSVTSIGDRAFYDCSSLMSVVIPNSVTSIGNYAFYGCSSLTSVVIGDSVTSIGSYAFSNCSSLTIIEIPNSVTSIGKYAFEDCSSLTSIEIPNSVTSIGDRAFSYCSSLTIYCKAESQPSGWSSSWNSSNRPVAWGFVEKGVTEDGFVWARLKENTMSIVGYTGTQTEISIPNAINGYAVTSIRDSAFSDCDSLTSVVIGDSVTSIGDRAFYDCSRLTSVVIPDSVTSIGNYAFYDCSSLTSVVIPNSVTSIGSNAFHRCSSLTSVVIGESVTSIGSYAFYSCSSLTSIEIHNSVTSIGEEAFGYCSKLTSITVSENNTKYKSVDGNLYSKDGKTLIQYAIGKTATSFTIPDSVTSIGEYAFYGCDSLTSVEIGDSVTSIGDSAFAICSSLTSIEIPDSVTSIGEGAFAICSSLTIIEIPNSVTSIGSSAFYNCDSLTSVTFKGTKTQWGNISKGSSWDYNVSATYVQCTDGTVSI